MLLASIGSLLCIIYKSLEWLWLSDRFGRGQKHFLSIEYFVALIITYVILLIGFGFIYTFIEMAGYSIILESGNKVEPPFFHIVGTCMYFSAVTLFSLGYGDIVPIGIGRWFAVVEALIGYLLPAAFVVKSVIHFEGSIFKERG